MARPLGRETITILTAALVNNPRDNSEYRDWVNPTRTDVDKCNVQPFIMSEKLQAEYEQDREFLKFVFRVWIPAGVNVEYTDRIEWRGDTYEVLGVQGLWSHINSGREHHRDFLIRRRIG